jgi:MFS family permease
MIDETPETIVNKMNVLNGGESKYDKRKLILQIIFLGVLTLLTVTSNALLHSNKQEFILDRFSVTDFTFSLYDTLLYLAYFVTGIIVGIISDKIAKRKLFVIIGSVSSSLMFYLLTLPTNYGLVLFIRFMQGCFSIMVWQILMTIILDLSNSENRGRNMGIYGIFLAIGMGLGPMLGGFIAAIGVFVPYYFSAGIMAIVLIASIFLKEPTMLKERTRIKDSFLLVKNNPKIIIPGFFNFVDRLHMGFIIFTLPLIIGLSASEGGLGLDPKYRGIAFGIFALPFILLQYPFGRLSDKIGRYILLIIGSSCYGVVLSFLGFYGNRSFALLVGILVMLGFFSGVTSPASMALVGDNVEKNNYGAGMGFFTLLGNLGIAIGPAIAGLTLSYGFGITFLIAGILEIVSLMIIISLVLFVFKEKIRIKSKKRK